MAKYKPTETAGETAHFTTMKIFNAIQIVTILTSSPIWLSWLQTATFTGHTVALWIGAIVSSIFFCWAIAGIVETMD